MFVVRPTVFELNTMRGCAEVSLVVLAVLLTACSSRSSSPDTTVDSVDEEFDMVDDTGEADPDGWEDAPDAGLDADAEEALDVLAETWLDADAEGDVEVEPDPLEVDDDGDGYTETDGDCDDTNDLIYPGSTNVVVDRDYDCDGVVEWQVTVLIAADDAYDLYIDGVSVGSGAGHDSVDTWVVESTPGDHVLGVHHMDSLGVASGLAVYMRAGGKEYVTRGVRSGDLDAVSWRYYPPADTAPPATWAEVSHDASSWSPALLIDEHDDGVWLMNPQELQGLDVEWIWRPDSPSDSWFRLQFELPVDEGPAPPDAGTCTASAPLVVGPGTERIHGGVDLLWDGSGLAALTDTWYNAFDSGADELFFHSLTASGAEVSPRVMVNETGGSRTHWWNTNPAMTLSGSGFGVVWEDGRHNRDVDQIYFRILDATGAASSNEARVVSTDQPSKHPDIASDGTEYAVVWQDERDAQREIYGVQINFSGTILGVLNRITNEVGASRRPTLAFDSTNSRFAVAWQDDRHGLPADGNVEIYFQLLDINVASLGSPVRVTDDVAYSGWPSLAFDGVQYGLAWADERDGNREIYFCTITADGTAGAPVRATSSRGISSTPSLIATTGGWAIAFRDDRDGVDDLYLIELDADGTLLNAPSKITSTPGSSRAPALSATSTGYAVIWEEETDPVTTPGRFYPYLTTVDCP